MIIGDGAMGIGDFFPAFPSITIPPVPASPRAPRIFEFDGNLNDGIRMRLDPRARVEIQEQAGEAARRARDATRDLMERLERLKFDVDRRADDATEATVAPPARVRTGTRIAGAGSGSGFGYGYATSAAPGEGSVAFTVAPEARTISSAGNAMFAAPAEVTTSSRVATWSGDDATFTLQGLRLARVNDDLAANLGRGSDRGFLILDASRRWSGLRAGDVLLEVDGQPVRDGNGARISLGAGDDHTAEVIREGRQRVVSVDMR